MSSGDYPCPICGQQNPHWHTPQEIRPSFGRVVFGPDGETVIERASPPPSWQVIPVPDPTNERIKELEREVKEWREITESLLNALDACPYCLTPKGKPHTCKLARLLEKP